MRRRTRRRAQVTVEFALLFGVVVAALLAMAIYLQRAAQGGIKQNADSLGTQFSSTSPWTSSTNSSSNTTENANTITINQVQNTHYNQTISTQ